MIKKEKQFVFVTFNKEGYHCFPEAADDPTFATGDDMDVSHLAARHFHYFYFKVWVEVNHTNRDIEFIQLRRWLEKQYDSGSLELNNKSCEMISDDLAEIIHEKYPNSEIAIEVSEDNINGSMSTYVPRPNGMEAPGKTEMDEEELLALIEAESGARYETRRRSGWNPRVTLRPGAVG